MAQYASENALLAEQLGQAGVGDASSAAKAMGSGGVDEPGTLDGSIKDFKKFFRKEFVYAKGIRETWVLRERTQRAIYRQSFSKNPLAKGFDLDRITVSFWKSIPSKNVRAFTIGDHVTFSRAEWNGHSTLSNLRLVGHEVTHSVQYDIMGYIYFGIRYRVDELLYGDKRYDTPGGLKPENSDLSTLSPVDPRFTLDALADRFAADIQGF